MPNISNLQHLATMSMLNGFGGGFNYGASAPPAAGSGSGTIGNQDSLGQGSPFDFLNNPPLNPNLMELKAPASKIHRRTLSGAPASNMPETGPFPRLSAAFGDLPPSLTGNFDTPTGQLRQMAGQQQMAEASGSLADAQLQEQQKLDALGNYLSRPASVDNPQRQVMGGEPEIMGSPREAMNIQEQAPQVGGTSPFMFGPMANMIPFMAAMAGSAPESVTAPQNANVNTAPQGGELPPFVGPPEFIGPPTPFPTARINPDGPEMQMRRFAMQYPLAYQQLQELQARGMQPQSAFEGAIGQGANAARQGAVNFGSLLKEDIGL